MAYPKNHKTGVPLRPILAMVRSTQHATAQWLAEVLQPVLEKYSEYAVKESFSVSKLVKESSPSCAGHMCSYGIVSLFTDVPLEETINICANALYRLDDLTMPALKEASFRKLIKKVTAGVEFSLNNMYQQIDGVAMRSLLVLVL